MSQSLFEERLEVAEERLRRLYMEREEGGPSEDAAAPPDDSHSWPGEERLALRKAEGDRLAHLVGEFHLSERETDLLVTCLLPELKPVCGAAFQFLSGLPTSRPSVSVALSVQGIPLPDAIAGGLLRQGSPLFDTGLMACQNPEAVFPERVLDVPDRVLDFLVGRAPGGARNRWLCVLPYHPDDDDPQHAKGLDTALAADPHRTRYLRQGIHGEALPASRAALAATGLVPLLLDPDALTSGETSPQQLAAEATLEARLLGAAVLLPLTAPAATEPDPADQLRRLVTRLADEPVPLLLYGSQGWAAYGWDTPQPVETDLRAPDARRPGDQLGAAASVSVERIHRASALHAITPALQTVREAARQRAAGDLGGLARHIAPEVGWQDLVLPDGVRTRLDMLVARVRHRETVFDSWGLRRGGGRGKGTAALFAGESGTGKTMAAEAVARELDLDLYVISLPSIVSKYIGETEKNLERVFSAAEMLDAVVLFDEADSMFSKRGEVKSSNDRHANMQSGYLLQRLEAFNGLAVLTTNLRSNIDAAFTRRFDEVVHFESPGPEVRVRLWRSLLGASAPEGLCLDALAESYDLAGGSIRACVESAAFTAAAAQRPLSREDLLQGVETEYGKLGRFFAPAD
ncbi:MULTISPECIES: ATP-binding protein [unclassified Streptomyces]|uniref:ATP-binding protein n=1 Tax=unclassified Streptomyces TaxID=2593676 RepID=UPI0038197B81